MISCRATTPASSTEPQFPSTAIHDAAKPEAKKNHCSRPGSPHSKKQKLFPCDSQANSIHCPSESTPTDVPIPVLGQNRLNPCLFAAGSRALQAVKDAGVGPNALQGHARPHCFLRTVASTYFANAPGLSGGAISNSTLTTPSPRSPYVSRNCGPPPLASLTNWICFPSGVTAAS